MSKKLLFTFGLLFTIFNLIPVPCEPSFFIPSEPVTRLGPENKVRCGGQNSSIPLIRRFGTFFIPGSGTTKQCSQTEVIKFPYGPGSGNGGSTAAKKNKGDEDKTFIQGECRPRVLKYRIKEDDGLIRAAEKACKNQEVQDDINAMEENLRQGNMNPGIGSKSVGEGITECRGRHGGRILIRESKNSVVEILGKSGKDPTNQKYVINRVKKVFRKNKK